jgi:hypothetical protein
MFYSLDQAMAQATPAACKEVLSQGFKFAVAVETAAGRWFILNTADMEAANNTARQWVDVHGAHGASIWRIFEDGLAPKSLATIFAEPEWQPADDLIDPTECMDTEEYIAWVESQSEGGLK